LGDTDTVKKMIKSFENIINAQNSEGHSALFWALSFHRDKIAQLLIACRASITLKTNLERTALHTAVTYNASPRVLQMLIASKADVHERTGGGRGQTVLHLICSAPSAHFEVNSVATDHKDKTEVIVMPNGTEWRAAAHERARLRIMRIMLAHGAINDLNQTDQFGYTPAESARFHQRGWLQEYLMQARSEHVRLYHHHLQESLRGITVLILLVIDYVLL